MSNLSPILSNTYTTEQLYSRLALLREALERYFFKGEAGDAGSASDAVRRFLAESGADDETKGAISGWSEEFINSFTADNLYDELQKLWDAADDLPRLTLYTSINLRGEPASKAGRWARENLDERIILDVHIEPSVIAGASFVWQGKHHDYSVRRLLRDKREEIKELVASTTAENGQQ